MTAVPETVLELVVFEPGDGVIEKARMPMAHGELAIPGIHPAGTAA